MADLPVIQLVASKGVEGIGDCGICAIATICDRTYEDVVAVAVQHVGENWKNGLYQTQAIAIAKDLGINLKRRKKYSLDTDVGILDCTIHLPDSKRKTPQEHFVVLMEGRIYDGDLRCWAVDAFKEFYRAKFNSLLEVQ